ncbi:MAG: NfeD family protein [Deltaproteobacteria bacterium]|nr:NfeD family protein [Deltaproteobacteria bacterium]
MQFLYWHWLVFGMILILAELFIPSFTIIWFGLGAMGVGLLAWVGVSPGLKWQLLLWILFSAGFTAAWFLWINPLSKDRTKAGNVREALLGQRCLLTRAPSAPGGRGECRFSVPILGSDTWPCLLEGEAGVGDAVMVKEVLGNAVLVVPATSAAARVDS